MLNTILNNFHVFVLISTIVYYILLRFYKRSVLLQQKKNDTKDSSNLIYVLFVPVLLYLTRFIFLKTQITNNYYGGGSGSNGGDFSGGGNYHQLQTPNNYGSSNLKVDRYLKSSYPESTISSASITI